MALLRPAFQPPAPTAPVGSDEHGDQADQLGEDEYEVERIVDERKRDYRVRWKGYDVGEDSWVKKVELELTAPTVVAEWKALREAA